MKSDHPTSNEIRAHVESFWESVRKEWNDAFKGVTQEETCGEQIWLFEDRQAFYFSTPNGLVPWRDFIVTELCIDTLCGPMGRVMP